MQEEMFGVEMKAQIETTVTTKALGTQDTVDNFLEGKGGNTMISPYLRQTRNFKPVYRQNTGGGAAKYEKSLCPHP